MIEWNRSNYASGLMIYSAMVGDVAISVIPSLTVPVEWRIETSIVGLVLHLADVGAGDSQEVLSAANKALLEECTTRIACLRTELEAVVCEHTELARNRAALAEILAVIKPVAKERAAKGKRGSDAVRHKGKPKKKATRRGYFLPDEESPFYGKKLAAARKGKKLTQEKAGKQLGIQKGTLSAIERGKSPIDERLILKFVKLYDLTV